MSAASGPPLSTSLFAVLAFAAIFPTASLADERPHSFSIGGGVRDWGEDDSGTEAIAAVQARIRVRDWLSIRVGEEIVCTKPVCAALGFHTAGLMLQPLRGAARPYLFGALSVFLHGAHPADGEARPYNIGLHWSAGIGVEVDLTDRVGGYIEAGLLGDTGFDAQDYRATTLTAGAQVRFGSVLAP